MNVLVIAILAALVAVIPLRLMFFAHANGVGFFDRFSLALWAFGNEAGGLTRTAADAVLKEDYKGPISEQLNNGNVFLAQVERNDEDVVGKRALVPLHVGRNTGVGARGERKPLPTAGNQRYRDVYIPVRSMYARIEVTGQTIKAMSKDRGSFIRAIKSETEGALTDAKRDQARQVYGNSNGVIATADTSTTTTTINLASTTTETQLRHLEEGFLVDLGTTADYDSVVAGATVVSVDYTNKRITIDSAVSTTPTTLVSRNGAGGHSDNSGAVEDGQYELTGLQTIVKDTGVLHTLNASTEPKWASKVDSNSGTQRQISENLVTKLQMNTETKSGKRVNFLVSNEGVFRSYGSQLVTLKRFDQTVELKGGYSGVDASAPGMGRGKNSKTVTFTWDYDAPNNKLFGLTLEDFTFYEMADWDWMDDDGAVLQRVIGYDAYEAVLYKYGELAATRRNSHFLISDIIES